jgi:hypothetical protein
MSQDQSDFPARMPGFARRLLAILRQRKANASRQVRKGLAAQLLWTMAEHDTSIEDVAEQFDCELYCNVGPPEADSPATVLGLAVENSRAQPRDRPLAWLLSAGSTGSWGCAYEIPTGEWWTLVCANGRLLPGPACDKIHADAATAMRALKKEIEEAALDQDPIRKIYVTHSLGLASAQCEEIEDSLDEALKRVAQMRKLASQGLLSRRPKLPRMMRTRASEHFKRQLVVGGLGVSGIALAAWAIFAFVDFAQLQRNVAPPPPPPPPPPWQAPIARLTPSVWLEICGNRTRSLRFEIPGWELESLECNDTLVRGRWKRRPGLAPFNTLGNFESYWQRNAPAGIAIVPDNAGDVVVASVPFVAPGERAGLPVVVPALGASQITRFVWTQAQRHAIQIELKQRQQLPAIPNARSVYFSFGFQSEFEDIGPLASWADKLPVPGLSVRTALWKSKDRNWTISGEIFERN